MPEVMDRLVKEALEMSAKIIQEDILVLPLTRSQQQDEPSSDPYFNKPMIYISETEATYDP